VNEFLKVGLHLLYEYTKPGGLNLLSGLYDMRSGDATAATTNEINLLARRL